MPNTGCALGYRCTVWWRERQILGNIREALAPSWPQALSTTSLVGTVQDFSKTVSSPEHGFRR
jgi:hypothetical protein